MPTRSPILTRRAPLYRDSAFVFESIEQSQRAFAAELDYPQSADDFIYTRYANPNVIETEAFLAEIEGSAWTMLTSSGMSAIDVALSAYQQREQTGVWLFFDEIYGGTNAYISQVLEARRGVSIARFPRRADAESYDLDALNALLDRVQPRLLYFEPVSNPLLIAADGEAIIKAAKARGIAVLVDNTFATPQLWRPLESGADLVIHSATKYFSGHGNLTAGVVCGNDPALHKALLTYRKLVGHILSPDDAYRLGTQVKTFELRFTRQCENASRLAHTLNAHDKIQYVRYPGLATHPTHREARTTFGDRGFGAMITFELAGGRAACDTFIAHVAPQIRYATTLGDPTTILIHVPTVFTEERFPYPGMIRMSLGFEPYQPLEACILDALEHVG
jgi:cystathionine beta-lyase/cystathionine gamma-synthase